MDVGELLSSLGEDDVKKLKEMASQFFGSDGGGQAEKGSGGAESAMAFDPGLLKSVAKMSSLMNAKDPRCDFIVSLKPLLSEKRRRKADEAVMLLRVFRLLSETEGLR